MSRPCFQILILSPKKSHLKRISDILSTDGSISVKAELFSHLSPAIQAMLKEDTPDAIFCYASLYNQPRWHQPIRAIAQKFGIPLVVFRDSSEPLSAPRIPDERLIELDLTQPISRQKAALRPLIQAPRQQAPDSHAGFNRSRRETFFNEAPVMNVIARLEDCIPTIVDFNKAFRQAVGQPAQKILNQPLYQFLSPPSRKRFEAAYCRDAVFTESQPQEYELLGKDGAVIHTLMHFVPGLQDDDGRKLLGFIFIDISERKKMEDELRKLSSIIEQTADHVVVTDIHGKIEYVNPAFERLTGYSAREVLGKPIRILKSGKHSQDFYQNLWETILAGKVFRDIMINRRKDGELFYEEKTISPIKDEEGNILYFVSTGKDITERKMLEERLERVKKLETLGRLAAEITHDFNHILSLIISHAENMSYELEDQPVFREQLQEIIKAAQAGANITRKLLVFSKTQHFEPQTFDVKAKIEKMQTMLRRLIPKNIALQFEAPSEPIHIHMDPAQIDQLILNFVINARDALPRGGQIVISLQKIDFQEPHYHQATKIPAGRYALIRISDNGTGIPEEAQQHIFEPFFSTKKSGKGTGLGLSTNYGIVKQNHGYIFVESQPGRGTTFDVYFPRIDHPETQENITMSKPHSKARSTPTVLVVDDSDIIRNVVQQALKRKSYQVFLAETGQEALKYIHERNIQFDLLISDIQLPDANGYDVAMVFRKHQPQVKILFMSGYGLPDVDEDISPDKGMTFLQKPFSMEEFWQKVNSLLESDA